MNGVSPMITSMKSTHGRIPLKHSVVKLYMYSSFMLNVMIAYHMPTKRTELETSPEAEHTHERGSCMVAQWVAFWCVN